MPEIIHRQSFAECIALGGSALKAGVTRRAERGWKIAAWRATKSKYG
jgi:hypothetical protein